MSDSLLLILLMVPVALLYYRTLRLAQRDMADRTARGESSLIIWLILLLPIVGPLLYLVLRQR